MPKALYHYRQCINNSSCIKVQKINYYSKSLKEMRLSILRRFAQFRFDKLDIKNFEAVDKTFAAFKAEKHSVNCIVNLAAMHK